MRTQYRPWGAPRESVSLRFVCRSTSDPTEPAGATEARQHYEWLTADKQPAPSCINAGRGRMDCVTTIRCKLSYIGSHSSIGPRRTASPLDRLSRARHRHRACGIDARSGMSHASALLAFNRTFYDGQRRIERGVIGREV